jgi:hypothetical protein
MITNSVFKIDKRILIIFISVIINNCSLKKPINDVNEDYFNSEYNQEFEDLINEEVAKKIYKNKVYSENIKSVTIGNKSIDVGEPMLTLNSNSAINISFDQLDDQINNLQYEIIHCNVDWQESELMEMEFLDGYKVNYIDNISKSFGTLNAYVHYEFNIPNENIALKKSGNYIIKIFDEYEPEISLANLKFYVSENIMDAKFKIVETSNFDERNYQQEFEFSFSYDPNTITDPYNNFLISIQQNHQEFNEISVESPNFVREKSIVYLANSDRVFDGGNEFRFFDISSFRKVSEKVNTINYIDSTYHIELIKEPKRSYKQYLSYKDLNGKFFLRSFDHQNDEIQSEYGWVNFHLSSYEVESNDVYIYGQLSNWEINEKFKMTYDSSLKEYSHKVFLKQGYYNYLYVTTNEKGNISHRTIEGAHFETENEFIIKAYYRDPIDLYDRILSYKVFNSRN